MWQTVFVLVCFLVMLPVLTYTCVKCGTYAYLKAKRLFNKEYPDE